MSNREHSRREFLVRPFRNLGKEPDSDYPNEQGKIPDYYISSAGEMSVRPEFSIISDFSSDQLYFEVMNKGIDPSNLDENQMRQILYDLM